MDVLMSPPHRKIGTRHDRNTTKRSVSSQPQHLLHRSSQVVVPKPREYSTKPGNANSWASKNACCMAWKIGAVKGGRACHATHAKQVHLLLVAGKLGVGFVPIHLRFLAKGVALRNADLLASAT
jgi:hypothetical protein